MPQSMIFLGNLSIILAAFRYSPSISTKVAGENLPHTDMEKVTSGIIDLKYVSSKSLDEHFLKHTRLITI